MCGPESNWRIKVLQSASWGCCRVLYSGVGLQNQRLTPNHSNPQYPTTSKTVYNFVYSGLASADVAANRRSLFNLVLG
jgi:hypothetical protein